MASGSIRTATFGPRPPTASTASTPDPARLLGKILTPELVSNVCFGGRAKHQLFITATTSVYAIILNRQGVQRP